MTFSRRICAFEGCSCAANPHHEIAPYCSAYCAVADREAAEGACSCGHDACEAVGRNPEASTKILVQSIIAMALAEGLGLIALFL